MVVIPFQLVEILGLDKGDEMACKFDIENRAIIYKKAPVGKDR